MKYVPLGIDGDAAMVSGDTVTFDFSSLAVTGNGCIVSAAASDALKISETSTAPDASIETIEGPKFHGACPDGHAEIVVFEEYTDTVVVRAFGDVTNLTLQLVDIDFSGQGSSASVITNN